MQLIETTIIYKGHTLKIASYGEEAASLHEQAILNPAKVIEEQRQMYEDILTMDCFTEEEKERAKKWLDKFVDL